MKSVCVMGLGYIGLPTAAILASNGFKVLGVDVDQRVVDTVNSGNIHIEEPGLHTVVKAAIGSGNLRASTKPESCEAFILAVPTPLTDDKKADMKFVESSAEMVVPYLQPGCLVVLESTSPPATCRDLLIPILEKSGLKVGRDLYLAHCPERVLPGKILKELIQNDRVIGGIDAASAERAREIYATFVEGQIFMTDATTAETVKLVENTFRDVNIALANELALVCERMGIDFWEVARLANRHPRVNVHSAGPGVGGHCISVDPWFIVEKSPEQAQLIHLSRQRNDSMPEHVADKIMSLIGGTEKPKVVALGLTYKGNVDDLRESPSIHVVELLQARGVEVAVYEPHVQQCKFALSAPEEAFHGADCVVLLTDHDEYRALDPRVCGRTMRRMTLFDTRCFLDHEAWRTAGFHVVIHGSGKQEA